MDYNKQWQMTLNPTKCVTLNCIKVAAYITLVRPILEYASIVWDPHQQYLINDIEMVQR